MKLTAWVLALGIALSACGAVPESDAAQETTEATTTTTSQATQATPSTSATSSSATTSTGASSTTADTNPTTTVDNQTMPTEPENPALVEIAITDLATRLTVSPDSIEVLRVEEVTWPNGALGCPQPGKAYTQALVDGGRIVLQHGETVYVYHYGDGGDPFLCPNPDTKDGGYEFVPPPGDDTK